MYLLDSTILKARALAIHFILSVLFFLQLQLSQNLKNDLFLHPSICSGFLAKLCLQTLCLQTIYSSYPPLGKFLRPNIFLPAPLTSQPAQKLASGSKMTTYRCSLSMVVCYTVVSPWKGDFKKQGLIQVKSDSGFGTLSTLMKHQGLPPL